MARPGMNLYIALDSKEFSKAIEGLSDDYRDLANRVLYEYGKEIRDTARYEAPVRTGALRASIYVTRPPKMKRWKEGQTPGSVRGYTVASETAFRRHTRAIETKQDIHGQPYQHSGRKLKKEDITTIRNRIGRRKKIVPSDRYYFRNPSIKNTYETVNGNPTFNPVAPSVGFTNPNGVAIGASVYYAIYQEYGTRRFKARAFLRGAIETVEFEEIVKEVARVHEEYMNARK